MEWRSVPGYEGYYEVSDTGRVWSVSRTVVSANGQRRMWRGRFLRQHLSSGYPCVTFSVGGAYTKWLVHALVMLAFEGPRPAGLEVCHGDGNSRNCKLSNLRYGTHSENQQDRFKHGQHPTGDQCHFAKLTAQQVAFIRGTVGISTYMLAKKFGVSQSAVSLAQRRVTWKHI